MEYKVKIFSSPGYKYNESDFMDIKKHRKEDSFKITKLDNIGTLDIKQLFNAIYNGFDGIFVIIRGKLKGVKFVSEYNSFQKIIDEANRILEKRGFSNQRIIILYLNGNDYKKLSDDIRNSFRKIIKCGRNPINNEIMDFQRLKQENSLRVV